MTCPMINLYRKKGKHDMRVWSWSPEVPDDVTAAAENEETAILAILVRNMKSFDSPKSLETDSITTRPR